MIELHAWQMSAPREPLVEVTRQVDVGQLLQGQVLVQVAGCGVCHTDLGFYAGGVKTKHPLPLTLGHEIAGRVVAAGPGMAALEGRAVIVPAVIPCGECALCKKGRGSICRAQLFPGSDVDGGFASHVIVPGRGLCPVDLESLGRVGLELSDLSVVADAVSTPYQAVKRSGLGAGDVAVFVGIGGVGGFGVQIARALGAHVVAIDVEARRLERIREYGAELTLDSSTLAKEEVRKKVQAWAKQAGYPLAEWKIFETSGHPAGQELAFSLLNFGANLSLVGYTIDNVSVRLSNLMAFDATAQGNWGCLPELYPAALELVLSGSVKLQPFIERLPMSQINQTFQSLEHGAREKRPVLVPDF